jgi:hypothetical protein
MVEMKLQLYFEPTSKIFLQENVKPELSHFSSAFSRMFQDYVYIVVVIIIME